jgi:ketosteroid isomerase-like protein
VSLASFEKRELEEFTRNFESLFYAGDAAAMASFYADDAKLMAEDREAIEGRTAIERFWRVACDGARTAKARRTITVHEVAASGDLGYGLGTVRLRIPRVGGPEREVTFKYATIWRREGDGRWRLVVDISNRNPPV